MRTVMMIYFVKYDLFFTVLQKSKGDLILGISIDVKGYIF